MQDLRDLRGKPGRLWGFRIGYHWIRPSEKRWDLQLGNQQNTGDFPAEFGILRISGFATGWPSLFAWNPQAGLDNPRLFVEIQLLGDLCIITIVYCCMICDINYIPINPAIHPSFPSSLIKSTGFSRFLTVSETISGSNWSSENDTSSHLTATASPRKGP